MLAVREVLTLQGLTKPCNFDPSAYLRLLVATRRVRFPTPSFKTSICNANYSMLYLPHWALSMSDCNIRHLYYAVMCRDENGWHDSVPLGATGRTPTEAGGCLAISFPSNLVPRVSQD